MSPGIHKQFYQFHAQTPSSLPCPQSTFWFLGLSFQFSEREKLGRKENYLILFENSLSCSLSQEPEAFSRSPCPVSGYLLSRLGQHWSWQSGKLTLGSRGTLISGLPLIICYYLQSHIAAPWTLPQVIAAFREEDKSWFPSSLKSGPEFWITVYWLLPSFKGHLSYFSFGNKSFLRILSSAVFPHNSGSQLGFSLESPCEIK